MQLPREQELAPIARIADRLWASRPLAYHGRQPHRSRAGNGVEFLDFRDYADGDDARWLDWRASARTRQPQVRRFHDETASDWVLCLDHSASMATPAPAKWQRAAQICAAMAFLLLHRGNRVGLALFSDALDGWAPPGRGSGQYRRLLSLLQAGSEPKPATGSSLASCLAPVQRLDSMLIISDFLVPDAMRGDLSRCLQRGGEVDAMQILAPDECAVGETYPQSITDAEQPGRSLQITRADTQAARNSLAEHRRQLASFCLQRHIRHSCSFTDSNWQDCVVRHLMRNRNAHA